MRAWQASYLRWVVLCKRHLKYYRAFGTSLPGWSRAWEELQTEEVVAMGRLI